MVNKNKGPKSPQVQDLEDIQQQNKMKREVKKLQIESIAFIGSLLSILTNPIIDLLASFDDKESKYQIAKQELLEFKANRESRMETRDMQKDTQTVNSMLTMLNNPNFPEDKKGVIEDKIAGIYDKYKTKLENAIQNQQFDGKTNGILDIIGQTKDIAKEVSEKKQQTTEIDFSDTNTLSTPQAVGNRQPPNSQGININ
jgi:hypothetical protein